MANRVRIVPGTKYRALDGRFFCVLSGCDGRVNVAEVATIGRNVPVGDMSVEEFEDLLLGPEDKEGKDMRTDEENRSKILGSIRDMARAQVELHKLLAVPDLSQSAGGGDRHVSVLNNAKLLVQDAKDKLNVVKLEE